MAKATITTHKTINVVLALNELEAKHLMTMVQNPLEENENPIVRDIREEIFHSLDTAGVDPF